MVAEISKDKQRDGATTIGRAIGAILAIALYGIVFYPIYLRIF